MSGEVGERKGMNCFSMIYGRSFLEENVRRERMMGIVYRFWAVVGWDKGGRGSFGGVHYFTVTTSPGGFRGVRHWNSIWKRSGVSEPASLRFFDASQAEESAHWCRCSIQVARAQFGRGGKGGARDQASAFAWRLLNQNPLKVDLDGLRRSSEGAKQEANSNRRIGRYFAARSRQRLRRQINREGRKAHLWSFRIEDCNDRPVFPKILQSAGGSSRRRQIKRFKRIAFVGEDAAITVLRRARPRPHLDQIRPHGLGQMSINSTDASHNIAVSHSTAGHRSRRLPIRRSCSDYRTHNWTCAFFLPSGEHAPSVSPWAAHLPLQQFHRQV